MKRLFFSIFVLICCLHTLSAQETAGRERITNYQNPLATETSRDSFEIARFDRRLGQLQTAFEAQDMNKVIENNRFLLQAMRAEIEELETKINAGNAATSSVAVLTQMNALLEAFEGHTYDFVQTGEAEKNFTRFSNFLELMKK